MLALAVCSAGGSMGCDDSDEEPTGRGPSPEEQRSYAGEAIYEQHCALCHGSDGEGYAADNSPALRNQEWLRTATDGFIITAINEGRPGTPMSAWNRRAGGPLRDHQTRQIVAYLRSWQDSPRSNVDAVEVDGDARRGRLFYAQHCARCHGAAGEGVDAVSLANPGFLRSASDGFIQYAIAHGRTGTRMRSYQGELSPRQIDDVVTFIRSWEPASDAPEPPPTSREGDIPTLENMELIINPDGGMPEFTLREDRFVPSAAVAAALDDGARMVILDARATSDWLRSRIPGAIPVPFYELDDVIEGLPHDGTWMIAYCACPHAASGRVVDSLRAAGYTHTAVLDEGIEHWENADFPTASGPAQP